MKKFFMLLFGDILNDNLNDTNKYERKEILVPEINNRSNNQKDSQQEMNN